ncbi:Aldo/keto reductase [Macrolepiota fuliginosa MF-IS2]|uniref:Aldo/keto reductase n=1 Tax=Macrolepiota fuliginosa MF-IS2 TaxID=1400762 RepID=A0A9P5XI37_9AGAR|nr:Aldo/keto reductase [Macrolepiota fuliginosa MF-IS2]
MAGFAINSTIRLSSGSQIPRLGFGVYQISKDETKASVLEALKVGYRHIDTAQLYKNEQEVGEAVREFGIPREQIYITTKLRSDAKGYDSASEAIDGSLKRLNMDYVDLFLIHDPLAGAAARKATWKALIDAKKAGKIKDIGVSNYNLNHLEEIEAGGLELPAINQIELHPLNQQRPIVEWCDKRGITVEAYCPLIRGQFDIPVLQALVQKYNKDPAQILVRWSLQRGFIPLPRSSKLARIRSNAQVYDFNLSDEDVTQLDKLDKGTEGAISWNPIHAD